MLLFLGTILFLFGARSNLFCVSVEPKQKALATQVSPLSVTHVTRKQTVVVVIRHIKCPDFGGTVPISAQMSQCPTCRDNVPSEDIVSYMPGLAGRGPTNPSVGMTPTIKYYIPCQSFFGYDNDKNLKVCFLVTRINILDKNK